MLRGVLFDLDGVLVDSLASIGACFNHALQTLGRPPLPLASLRPLIGPPLEESAQSVIGDDPQLLARFIAAYRERYAATAVAETRPAAGLVEVMTELAARTDLAVATSKPEVFARPILAGLGVDHCFRAICGRSLELDAEPKAAVIARALQSFAGRAEGLVMVGDRRHDVIGAAAHGIPTIGVLHGMGSEDELRAAGARWLAADLRALPGLLREIEAQL
ncbi:HAD hydrolase-like protein [Nannocystis sp. ILAH1]|uniref:HAD hydrolase-like protein n=1 Tax=unclassified Nannocystis TaxID=2627009 RepID=UPI00226D5BA1|nr:HAD hydrolase-like protein [Nannocystis sp. ILAH1]MCY1072665.1 HAD hydrolase-like protein [Nannocystis sp. RBIL2]